VTGDVPLSNVRFVAINTITQVLKITPIIATPTVVIIFSDKALGQLWGGLYASAKHSSEMLLHAASLFAFLAPTVLGTNILLTNDDGWAVAIIRAQFEALTRAGHDVSSFLFQQ